MAPLRPLLNDCELSDRNTTREMETLGWLMEILERSLEYSASTKHWGQLRDVYIASINNAQKDGNIDLLCAQLLVFLENVQDEALSYEGKQFRKNMLCILLRSRTQIFGNVNAEGLKIMLKMCRSCIKPDSLGWSVKTWKLWTDRSQTRENEDSQISVLNFYIQCAVHVHLFIGMSVAEYRNMMDATVMDIVDIADELDKLTKGAGIARIVGGSGSVAGGAGSTVGGIIVAATSAVVAPIVVICAGGAAMAIGGIVSIASSIKKRNAIKANLEKVKIIVNKALQSSLTCGEIVQRLDEALDIATPYLKSTPIPMSSVGGVAGIGQVAAEMVEVAGLAASESGVIAARTVATAVRAPLAIIGGLAGVAFGVADIVLGAQDITKSNITTEAMRKQATAIAVTCNNMLIVDNNLMDDFQPYEEGPKKHQLINVPEVKDDNEAEK